MKKLLGPILALASLAGPRASAPQTVDPRTVRFSLPTISGDRPEVKRLRGDPAPDDLVFDQDDWTQVEFLPAAALDDVVKLLGAYKPFEQAQRERYGWRDIYVRRFARRPVLASADPLGRLEKLLGVKARPAPVLRESGRARGRVRSGFTLPLGGKIVLYGFRDDDGRLPVLGAFVGQGADDSILAQAFLTLSASDGVLLVDWLAQTALLSVDANGQIEFWRP